MWKSNANEFRWNSCFSWLWGNFAWKEISLTIRDISPHFRDIYCFNPHEFSFSSSQCAAICCELSSDYSFYLKSRAFSCKIRCYVNRNHPSRCCSVTAWNISSITSRCSRKGSREWQKSSLPETQPGRVYRFKFSVKSIKFSLKLTLLVDKEKFAGRISTKSWHSLEKLLRMTYMLCNNTRGFTL